jgi:hypothetical protein
MPIRLEDGFSRFIQIVEVAELMRHFGQAAGHGLADGLLSIGNDPSDGHGHCFLDLAQQSGEISSCTAEQGPGQQHLAGQTVADNPEHLVTDIRLHSIDGQQDLALLLESGLYPLLIRQVQGDQFLVAF